MRGRPKGSTNHSGRQIREMIKEALDNAGGAEYLLKQSENNPAAFMGLIGKVIPADVEVQVAKSAWEAIDESEDADGNPTKA